MNEGKKDRRDPIRTKKSKGLEIAASKPRNFVAKNAGATTSGAGAHKDKKKADKQGYEKHKKSYAESLEQKLQEAVDQGVAEGLGSYDNDKGVRHTRESLVAKLEALPKGNDEFEWHKNRAIYHLQQGNMIRAKYYMALMKRGEQGVAEGEYDPSYDPEYRGYQQPEQDPDAWKQERDLAQPSQSQSTVIVYDAGRKEVLRFPSTGGYYGDVRYATEKGFNPEGPEYNIKWQKDVSEDQGMTDIADWKQAVLKAYPRYADHIKFKGRGTQVSAEVPGMDRSFGVFDLGTGRGEVLDEGKIYLEKLTDALVEAVRKL